MGLAGTTHRMKRGRGSIIRSATCAGRRTAIWKRSSTCSASNAVRVDRLVEIERPVEQAAELYAAVAGQHPPLAAVVTYYGAALAARTPGQPEVVRVSGTTSRTKATRVTQIGVALVGAGGFVSAVHLPNLKADDRVAIRVIANRAARRRATLHVEPAAPTRRQTGAP